MMNRRSSKDLYRDLCEKERSIPVFSQAWWLDATAGADNWDVVLVVKGDKVEASLPYFKKYQYGVTVFTTPGLTPSLGPWLRHYSGSRPKFIAREKDLITQLFENLPAHDVYSQNWSVERQNWQPLYWKGFDQSTGYTYRLNNLVDTDSIWAAMHQNTRNDVRKARDRSGVTVRNAESTEEVLRICNKTFERQNLPSAYSGPLVTRAIDAARKRNAIDLLVAEGPDGTLHAGAVILYGNDTAYYLMGGGDAEYRNSGAASLVLWEAVLKSSERVRIFDFEGSMIEMIERFFRGFGGDLRPYMRLSKAHTWRGRAYMFAQNWKKRRLQMVKTGNAI